MSKGKGADVKWYGGQVVTRVQGASTQLIAAIAQQALGHARVNLRDSGRVDTGFLINSGYVAADGAEVDPANGYSPQAEAGRIAAPEASPPKGGAVVGFAAEYALWQEFYKSYLLTGLQSAAQDAGKTAKVLGQ